jgi:sugar phosphate isomerase/epimerase
MLPHAPVVTPADAAAIAAAGFSGVSYMIADPLTASRREMEEVRDLLAAAGVSVAQANAQYPSLVDPDEERRATGVRTVQRACLCARWLGAATLYVRPGSLNPRGHWWPHPQNTAPATLERLISSLREIAAYAEAEGVVLALEGHVVSPLDSAERVRQILEAVDSPGLRFNADPVNFIGTLADAYDTGRALHHLFDELGPWVVAAHAKDIYVEDRHVLHLSECIPGEGLLDQQTFLRRFETCCPDGYVIVEHLPDKDIPQARRAIVSAAERCGLGWR